MKLTGEGTFIINGKETCGCKCICYEPVLLFGLCGHCFNRAHNGDRHWEKIGKTEETF